MALLFLDIKLIKDTFGNFRINIELLKISRLYPVLVSDVEMCYKLLNKSGIDAYLGATQLDLVESPIGSQYKYPKETFEFFNKVSICYLKI